MLDLGAGKIKTIIWATGYKSSFSWLDVPVLDNKGEVSHLGGVTPAPGLYAMGMKFLRRRKSTFIDGVGDDARDLSAHVADYLAGRVHVPSPSRDSDRPVTPASAVFA
jgi:putative flavoprotein involved in K+ transport